MVALPSADVIQMRSPRVSTNVPNVPNLGAPVAEGIAKIGAAIEDRQDEAAHLDYAKARSAFLTQKVAIEQQIQDDPNWQSAKQTYQDQITQARQQASSMLSRPDLRAKFDAEANLDTAEGGARVASFVHGKIVDKDRSDLNDMLDSNTKLALSSPDNAPAFLAANHAALAGARARGSISAVEEGALRRANTESYAKGWLTMMAPDQRVKVLAGRLGRDQVQGDIYAAISGQESGGNPNIGKSVDGAVGQFQIEPGTFAQYAQPGESIDNPQDNITVGHRIIDDLASKYPGDPARVAVGYFSGPGNVSPPGSPTPWLHDFKDGNGKSVSAYAKDVLARLGPQTSSIVPPNFDFTSAPGMKEKGNLDPWNRAVLHNADGTYSTTSSMSIGTDAGEVLIPTVVDGKRLSKAAAIERFQKTGENFGTFDTPDNADAFATNLHNAQASMYDEHGYPNQQGALSLVRKTGTPADFLSPDDASILLEQSIRQRHADATLAREEANQGRIMQDRATANTLLGGIYDGKVTTQAIINSDLPAFGTNSKDELLGMAAKLRTGTTDPSVWQTLFDRMNLPTGDRMKLDNEAQLRPYVGNGLSFDDYRKLSGFMSSNDTNEGRAINDLRKGLYDQAKAALVKGNLITGFSDPNDSVGREQLQKFMANASRREAAAIAKGVPVFELYDAASKNYLGKEINNFRLSDEQRMHAQAPSTPAPQTGTTVTKRNPGESPEQYLKRLGGQ